MVDEIYFSFEIGGIFLKLQLTRGLWGTLLTLETLLFGKQT